MQYRFDPAPPMQDGAIFLGLNDKGQPSGLVPRRHFVTTAGAQSGKGAGLIIPNLRQWSGGSVLVIDPKGENAEQSWEHREAMGHKVHVVDPFKVANVPARLRSAFNPLASVDQSGLSSREDIRVIADGLVMRHDPKHAMWDNGAVSVLSGMIAHNLSTAPDNLRTLPAIRAMLRQSDEQLQDVFADMAENASFGGLAQSAAATGLSEARSSLEFIKGARDQCEWLDSDAMASVLDHSDFDLADLKNGKTAVYLVLPPQYIQEHGRFLRLFVRCAIDAMAKGGNRKGGKCLFILDEFFSLGYIAEIATAAGLMPAYGVHLWPILQDLGQLVKLYEQEGAETFFGNADAHIFFGNTDPYTLDHISRRFGAFTPEEVGPPPAHTPHRPSNAASFSWLGGRQSRGSDIMGAMMSGMDNAAGAISDGIAAHQMSQYQFKAQNIGRPRLPPDQVREMVARHHGDAVARSMIVFGTGGLIHQLKLKPYFLPDAPPQAAGVNDAQIWWLVMAGMSLIASYCFFTNSIWWGAIWSFVAFCAAMEARDQEKKAAQP